MLNLKVSKQARSFRILQKDTLQKSHVILNQKKKKKSHKQNYSLSYRILFLLHHSFKINKWWGGILISSAGRGWKKINKLLSVPPQFIRHLRVYIWIKLKMSWSLIKISWIDEGNSWDETWHWTNDEIGVAVQRWLWVSVELMAW